MKKNQVFSKRYSSMEQLKVVFYQLIEVDLIPFDKIDFFSGLSANSFWTTNQGVQGNI
jgi:hypothetical protein